MTGLTAKLKKDWKRGARRMLCALLACAIVPALGVDRNAFAALAEADGSLRISEVMASNGGSVMLDDGSMPDWIEIENVSDRAVSLDGWALITEDAPNKPFSFTKGTLKPGEYVVVYCDGSGKPLVNGAWHAPFKLSAGGERVALLDKRGRGADLAETPSLSRDQVYCRDTAGQWQLSDVPTPGAANVVARSEGGVSARPVNVTPGALEISEAMSANVTYFADETGAHPDYIEIHNTSSATVNLGGWALSDNRSKLKKWLFPDVALPAGGYLAVHCSGVDRTGDSNHLHAAFKLSSDGEEIFLTSPKGQVADMVALPALGADQAYSRTETGWSSTAAPSPGYANTMEGAEAAAQLPANALGVYITEVLATTNRSDDWVELFNATSAAVDLSGYGLSDNAARPRKWRFPQGTTIEPGAYLGVFCNGADTVVGDRISSNYKLSADGGYSITLSSPSGAILDRLFVPLQYQNISYGRTADLHSVRYFDAPTPGTANSGASYYGRAPRPSYSTPGGLYHTGDTLTVTLGVPSGCRVYYTLDCTDPSESATAYTGPITIDKTTILRTKVYGDGYLESYMDTQSYLYDVNNADGTVFVASLVSDPDNLFDYERGIMVRGPNAWPEHPYGSINEGANFWMDWEREAHIEVFQPDAETMISQECGVKLHGQYSRIRPQQAFKLIARNQYGSGRFVAKIFSKRDFTEYQSFVLRATGQDDNRARMRDPVLTSLASDTSVYYQESELCVCYLNGEYWGQYNLRERVNPTSICQFEGWEGDEDALDLVKANRTVMQGSNETMVQLLDWLAANDVNTEAGYRALDTALDIQNYIEYMAIEVYTGNTDTLNVKRYRNARVDGKWRWVLFDLDWAFTEDTNSIRRWLTPGGMGTGNETDNRLFIACMKNDTFRDRFLTYLGQRMATTFSADSILKRFEAEYEAMKPLMADQLARWEMMSEELYAQRVRELIAYAQTRPMRMLQFLKYCEQLSLTQAQMEQYFGDAMRVVGVTYGEIPEI